MRGPNSAGSSSYLLIVALIWQTFALWHLFPLFTEVGGEGQPPISIAANIPASHPGEEGRNRAVGTAIKGVAQDEAETDKQIDKIGLYPPSINRASYDIVRRQLYEDTGLGVARKLQDWEVEDFFLISTVDGNLLARDRKTGQYRWELFSETPVVQTIYHRQNNTQTSERIADDEFVYIVEPTEDGVLFRYHPDYGLERTEWTMKGLMEQCPFTPIGSSHHFSAEKQTVTYAIDGRTGNVLRIFKTGGGAGMLVNTARCKPKEKDDLEEECESGDNDKTILVSRTEYTITIENIYTNELYWTIKYAEWGPNNSDRDLVMQHQKPMDNRYIIGIHDGRILGFDRTKGDEPKYTHNLQAPVARVFDVIRSTDTDKKNYLILPQPYVPAETRNDDEKTVVGLTGNGGWYALSELNYPFVSQGASRASCYQRKPDLFKLAHEERQKLLTGVHTTRYHNLLGYAPGRRPGQQLLLPAPTQQNLLDKPETSESTDPAIPSSPSHAIHILAMSNKWSIAFAIPFLMGLVYYWLEGPKLSVIVKIMDKHDKAVESHVLEFKEKKVPEIEDVARTSSPPQAATIPSSSVDDLSNSETGLPLSTTEESTTVSEITKIDEGDSEALVKVEEILQQIPQQKAEEEEEEESIIDEITTSRNTGESNKAGMTVVEKSTAVVVAEKGAEEPVVLQLPTPAATPEATPPASPEPSLAPEKDAIESKIVRFDEDGNTPEINETADDTEVPATPQAPTPKKKKAHRGQRGGKKKSKANKAQQEANDEITRIVDRAKDIQPSNRALEPDVKIINDSGDIDSTIIRIDNLEVHQNAQSTLGLGSQGTVVFKGKFEGRAVAVKRMLRTFFDVAHREVKLLQDSDDHPNVIRYHCMKELDQFLYIALEQCRASLCDVVVEPKHQDLLQLLDPQQVLRQIVMGVNHLHQMKIVHRDLKPQNILVSEPKRFPRDPNKVQHPRILISDFGLCKQLEANQSSFRATTAHAAGTSGWRAPELLMDDGSMDMRPFSSSTLSETSGGSSTETALFDGLSNRRATRAIDVFSMGCVFFFVLTQGGHPFGAMKYSREMNVITGAYDLAALEALGESGHLAKDLIQKMIQRQPKSRPDTPTILMHPYFWTPERRLLFLIDSSDRFEKEKDMEKDPKYKSPFIPILERDGKNIVRGDWLKRLDRSFHEEVLGNKRRGYDGEKVLDLLRVIRNKRNHYQDMTKAAQAAVGPLPDGYLGYFTSRYPDLFLHVYRTIIETGFAHKELRSYYAAPDS